MKTTMKKTLAAALLTSVLGVPVVSLAAGWFSGDDSAPVTERVEGTSRHRGLSELEMNQQ